MNATRQRIAQQLAKEATAVAAFLVAYAGGWEDADHRALSKGEDLDGILKKKVYRLGAACDVAGLQLTGLGKG